MMTDQSNKDIAYAIEGCLEPLGAQWADLEDAVRATGNSHAQTALFDFGQQVVKPWEEISREAAQRLASGGEISEALKECILQLEYLGDKFQKTGTGEAVIARARALLDTESEQ